MAAPKVGDLIRVTILPAFAKQVSVQQRLVGRVTAVNERSVQIVGRGELMQGGVDGACWMCGRPLTSPASLQIGVGPDCARSLGIDWLDRVGRRALTDQELLRAKRDLAIKKVLPLRAIAWGPIDGPPPVLEIDRPRDREDTRGLEAMPPIQPAPTDLVPLDVTLPDPYRFFPYQEVGVRTWMTVGNLLLADEMGLGKGHSLNTNVLTPSGWQQIGHLQVGDSVIGSDGITTLVTGVFSRGVLPLYRVTMSDGSSVLCDNDHLWAVQSALQKSRGKPFKVVSTRDLRTEGRLRDGAGNCRYYIPMVHPIEMDETPLAIDPYIMGVLLGDGHIKGGGVSFTKPDDEMGEEVQRLAPVGATVTKIEAEGKCPRWSITGSGGMGSNPVLNELRSVGLQGTGSPEKFVPDRYKFASASSRLALLQGLLDTDGSPGPRGNGVEFSSTSKQLVDDVQFLVESFGGTTHLSDRQTYFNGADGEKKAGLPSYRLMIALPGTIKPFRLGRKADKYATPTKYQPTRAIVSIEPEGSDEVVCISVAAPDRLYVTEHCIVTHNTLQVIGGILQARYTARNDPRYKGLKRIPSVIVCPKSLRANWAAELRRFAPELHVQVLDGRTDKLLKNQDIYITHPENLATRKIDDRPVLSKAGAALAKLKMLALVGDESHKYKTADAIRTLAMAELAQPAQYRALLSGTAILARPRELLPQLQILGKLEEHFGSAQAFRIRFCNLTLRRLGRRRVWDDSGRSNLSELNARLAPIMLRRKKEDVLKDLPEKTYARIVVELSNREQYQRFEDAIADAEPGQRAAMTAQLRRLLAEGKIEPAIDWIQSFLDSTEDEKLVVFAYHRNVQQALVEAFPDSARIFSDADMKRLKLNVEEEKRRFAEDPDCRVIVCSLLAAGFGHTLTTASNLLLVELDYTPGNMTQAADRIHRPGQQWPCTIWTLVAEDSVDDRLTEILVEKQQVTSVVLDGEERVLTEQTVTQTAIRDILKRVRERKKRAA